MSFKKKKKGEIKTAKPKPKPNRSEFIARRPML